MLSNIDNRIWENRMIAKLLVDPKLIQLLSETTSGLEEIRQNFSMFVTKVGGYFTLLPAIYIEH